jgi:hypothetical protein
VGATGGSIDQERYGHSGSTSSKAELELELELDGRVRLASFVADLFMAIQKRGVLDDGWKLSYNSLTDWPLESFGNRHTFFRLVGDSTECPVI